MSASSVIAFSPFCIKYWIANKCLNAWGCTLPSLIPLHLPAIIFRSLDNTRAFTGLFLSEDVNIHPSSILLSLQYFRSSRRKSERRMIPLPFPLFITYTLSSVTASTVKNCNSLKRIPVYPNTFMISYKSIRLISRAFFSSLWNSLGSRISSKESSFWTLTFFNKFFE